MSYHKLLQKQINKFLPTNLQEHIEVQNLLSAINESYNLFERDKDIAARAFSISEEEYIEINELLKKEILTKKESIRKLKEAFLYGYGQDIDNDSDDLLIIIEYLLKEVNIRKDTESKLDTYKKFSEDVLNNIPADIAVFDKNHNYIFINPKGVADTEIREWLIGKNDFDYCKLKGIDDSLAVGRRKRFNECVKAKSKVEYLDKHKVPNSEYSYKYILRNFYPYFENEELKFVIGYAIDITEKVEFEERLTKAIIKTQEDERLEIGSELHDNVCQILTAVSMGISMIKKSKEITNPMWIGYCEENISLALKETENLSHRLSPIFHEDIYFSQSIIKLVKDFNGSLNYELDLNIDKSINDHSINSEIQLNLFRILQEELRNIYKYANATSIKIALSVVKNHIILYTKDNGVGFELNEVVVGHGMVNIKRRVEILFGELLINTATGQGCEVVVKIPLIT
jgi:signal transduction histidine kinase